MADNKSTKPDASESASDRIGHFLWEIDRIQACFAGAVAVLSNDDLCDKNEDAFSAQALVQQGSERLNALRTNLDLLGLDIGAGNRESGHA